MGEIATFLMIGAAVVALFGWMSAGQWIAAQATERERRERYALLRHLAEQPTETAERVLEALRAEDEREAAKARARAADKRRRRLESSAMSIAGGAGLYYYGTTGNIEPAWAAGVMAMLVGLVLAGFALVDLLAKKREEGA